MYFPSQALPKDVFEKWYRRQHKFQKLERIPTVEELGSKYILVCDAAELLGISYDELVRLSKYGKYKCILKMIVFENKKWFLKKDFQNFLNAQNEYQLISQIETIRIDRKIELETKEYISREEAAVLAGVTKSTITKWIQADKISNNYYGTNNPDWKNALYEHKYFGLDVEHRDSNHVRL